MGGETGLDLRRGCREKPALPIGEFDIVVLDTPWKVSSELRA